MLESIINETIDKIAERMVVGKFSIGLKPIKEFIKFYIIAEYIQNELENETISILKYSKNNFIQSENIDEDDTDKADELEKEELREYDRKVDHYNTMNFKNKVKLKIMQKKEELYNELKEEEKKALREKNITYNGPVRRFKGASLHKFQIDEFRILDNIKEDKYKYDNLNKTYKRINSEKGYLKKMNFTEFETFYSTLAKEIQDSDYAYKNIRYYKLEKNLSFELIKSMLKVIHECKIRNQDTGGMIDDFFMLFKMPLLKERQIFVEEYPELDASEIMLWRTEVLGINKFIIFAIKVCKGVLKEKNEYTLTQTDMERFKNQYTDLSFKNNYRIRKDFYASDFSDLMKKLDHENSKSHTQVNDFFSRKTKNT